MLDVVAREGLARAGRWDADGEDVRLPAVLHPDTQRSPAPDFAQLTISTDPLGSAATIRYEGTRLTPEADETGEGLSLPRALIYPGGVDESLQKAADELNREEAPIQIVHDPAEVGPVTGLLVLPRAREVADDAWRLAGFLTTARRRAGPNAVIYAPGIGRPDQIALAAYAGVDVFDGLEPSLAALSDTYSRGERPEGSAPPEHPACACPACRDADREGWTLDRLREHNRREQRAETRRVRQAIADGRLRELVEQRVRASPAHLATLRRLDEDHGDLYERYAPTVREDEMPVVGRRSLSRPEVTRWLDRLETRHQAPESARTLVALPCSATKPYGNSPTHQRIRPAIKHNARGRAHVVTLTSPLGAVPEELELMYPAHRYDVPVTGDWNEREEQVIRRAFEAVWKNGGYEQAILHVPPDEAAIVEEALPRAERTVEPGERPTDDEATDRLGEAVRASVGDGQAIARDDMFAEHMDNRIDWQFGPGVADVLAEDTWIRGKYPWLRLMHGEDQLAMIKPERGALTLTEPGGRRLHEATDAYTIEIDDFRPKGTVFAAGVTGASEAIRPEDEVVCVHEGELRAVGRATAPGEIMADMDAGGCAEVRHRG
jgi:archaeosine synthase